MTWVCVDPGSTHDGDLNKARQLVEIAADIGADACKFQLLTIKEAQNGNVMMPWDWMSELIELGKSRGVEVFASVFDYAGLSHLASIQCQSVKFAYSQSELLRQHTPSPVSSEKSPLAGMKVYASYDVMSPHIYEEVIKLYCIPQYPVPYVVDFEGLFPRFDGFSSHCLGVQQEIRAVEAGAKCLEFHIKGPWDSQTPDAKFAKSPKVAAELIREIRFRESRNSFPASAIQKATDDVSKARAESLERILVRPLGWPSCEPSNSHVSFTDGGVIRHG